MIEKDFQEKDVHITYILQMFVHSVTLAVGFEMVDKSGV